jgi:hypothetical protein
MSRRTDEEIKSSTRVSKNKKIFKSQRIKNETAEFTQNAILLAIKRLLMSPIAAVVCK